MKRTVILCSTALLCIASPARAAEGMFLLDQLPTARLIKSGLKIPPAQLRQLSRAVVQVASGGTGSFVSPRGLLVTNHHVAYRCLAMLGARKEHLGLLDKGHAAASPADELPCPGYDLLVVDEIRDVKDRVLAAATPRMSWSQRFEALRLAQEDLVAECEKDGAHVCEVASLDGGRGYTLSVYRRIRDVRLVAAPPKSLGKFGGDVDNWMYPRHTADFAFLRAYVDAQGHGAAYAKDNVPLATPNHLRVSRQGFRPRSLVEVIGFPGRTTRHATSFAVRFALEQQLPAAQQLFKGLITTLHAEMQKLPDVQRKYAGLEAGLQNALKYFEMTADGMQRLGLLPFKEQEEQTLLAGLAGDRRALASAKQLLGEIRRVLGRYRTYHRKLATLQRIASGICPTMRMAHDLARWAKEKAKPNRMRKEERYKDKNVYKFIEAAERLELEVNVAAEKALLLHLLRAGEQLPRSERPRSTAALLRWWQGERARAAADARAKKIALAAAYEARFGVALAADPLAAAVDLIYARTALVATDDGPKKVEAAKQLRAEIFKLPATEVARFDDPLLRFARDVEGELAALKEGPHKLVEEYLQTVLHRRWVEEVKRPAYPDANFTPRLSFGSVQPYTASATGQAHRHVTTLAELLAKDQGAFPFVVPGWLKAAAPTSAKSRFADPALRDIPVNFTTTLDTTGGNSGSPVLDDHGRLIGLLFDGTPESILSDWWFLHDKQRSICVDIRFALYLAEVQRNAELLRELGVAPAPAAAASEAR